MHLLIAGAIWIGVAIAAQSPPPADDAPKADATQVIDSGTLKQLAE